MAVLDHVVINVLQDTDAAEAAFAELGFQLTPRGYHTLGSVNHLMVTLGAYLEIVGVPSEGRQRQEVLDSPRGLNGIVVQTKDATATFDRLVKEGFDPLPPMEFSRPVTINGTGHEASFRTVRMQPDFFGGGRIYFCQHLTPELVWRPEWMRHENGFKGIEMLEVESPDPAATADRLARAFDGDLLSGDGQVRVCLEDCEIHVLPGQTERMRATGLRFHNLAALKEKLRKADVHVSQSDDGTLSIGLPDLNATLLCRSA